jgi:Recombination endonuclease VII
MATLQQVLLPRICEREGCDNEISSNRPGTRFCSGTCQRAAWRNAGGGYLHLQPATCPRCDGEFLPSDRHRRVSQQVYCSRNCVNSRRFAKSMWSGGQRRECGNCGGDRGDSVHPSYCRPCQWALMLWSSYKITPEQFAAKLAEQQGRCGICRQILDVTLDGLKGKRRATRVDHCHKTGAFRGILCHRCNLGVGYFGDGDLVLLRRAADYIEGIARGGDAAGGAVPG